MALDKQKLEDIFHRACQITDAEARARYLDEACADDLELRREVEGVLNSHENASQFLEQPVADMEGTLNQEPGMERIGSVIGPYKLLEKIGEGGMAVVYMAEQRKPFRRRAALKILKYGMDTEQVIGRFEAERQALAMMDHHNIARVFDAGATETGRPYFVMELVKGVSITEYCDENQLSTEQRLELFLQACQAVQHAHQKGIIHRDIKPSNVMVTLRNDKPVVKVIDFGIAKATHQRLTEKTVFTRYAQMIGTPQYMSPEQAHFSELDIDTRTDIYSLGVLLYELLSGATPFDSVDLCNRSYGELQRIIREEEPLKPSTKLSTLGNDLKKVAKHRKVSPELLPKLIRGDLDWIVMKSLEKDRTRRYETANGLAMDLQRHLNNEAVVARPPSAFYQMHKFMKRHRAFVMVAAAIVVGFFVSTVMYILTVQAWRKEAQARSEAQAVIRVLTHDLFPSVYPENAKSSEVTVRYILEQIARNVKKLENSPLTEATIRETLGLAFQKLGDYALAEAHLKRALTLRRKTLGDKDLTTLTTQEGLGRLYMLHGLYTLAEPLLIETLDARTEILGLDHPDTIWSMCILAWQYLFQGRLPEAEPLIIQALNSGLDDDHRVRLYAMKASAFHDMLTGDPNEAYKTSKLGYDRCFNVYGKEHEETLYFMNLLAWSYELQRKYDEGIEWASRSLKISEEVVGESHQVTAQAMNELGWLYARKGQHETAVPYLEHSLTISNSILGPNHLFTLFATDRLAEIYRIQGEEEKMEQLLNRALSEGDDNAVTAIHILIQMYKTYNKPEAAEKWESRLPKKEQSTR